MSRSAASDPHPADQPLEPVELEEQDRDRAAVAAQAGGLLADPALPVDGLVDERQGSGGLAALGLGRIGPDDRLLLRATAQVGEVRQRRLEFELRGLFPGSERRRLRDEEGNGLLLGRMRLILENGAEASGVVGGGHGFGALLGWYRNVLNLIVGSRRRPSQPGVVDPYVSNGSHGPKPTNESDDEHTHDDKIRDDRDSDGDDERLGGHLDSGSSDGSPGFRMIARGPGT